MATITARTRRIQHTIRDMRPVSEGHRAYLAGRADNVPSLKLVLNQTKGDPLVVITGSLYLIGEALEWLHLTPEAGASERTLNEWGGAKHNPSNLPMR